MTLATHALLPKKPRLSSEPVARTLSAIKSRTKRACEKGQYHYFPAASHALFHDIPDLLDLVKRMGKSLNWFVHLAHGVGKAGHEPEPREEEAAADEARELLKELEL